MSMILRLHKAFKKKLVFGIISLLCQGEDLVSSRGAAEHVPAPVGYPHTCGMREHGPVVAQCSLSHAGCGHHFSFDLPGGSLLWLCPGGTPPGTLICSRQSQLS